MTVQDVKDITTEDSYIYYRKSYNGTAVLDIREKEEEIPIKFIIETEPTGKKNVEVSVLKEVFYPLLPVVQGIKKVVLDKSEEGLLPC